MGIYIHLSVSASVTQREWEEVYQETFQLVKAFHLAERRLVPIRGIPTVVCCSDGGTRGNMGLVVQTNRERVVC